eukprot:15070.XXX_790360_790671_1 [CDS] Oithona nana genome sequencing.
MLKSKAVLSCDTVSSMLSSVASMLFSLENVTRLMIRFFLSSLHICCGCASPTTQRVIVTFMKFLEFFRFHSSDGNFLNDKRHMIQGFFVSSFFSRSSSGDLAA